MKPRQLSDAAHLRRSQLMSQLGRVMITNELLVCHLDFAQKQRVSNLYGVKNLTMGINLRRRLSLVIVDDASQDISPPYWTISVMFSSLN